MSDSGLSVTKIIHNNFITIRLYIIKIKCRNEERTCNHNCTISTIISIMCVTIKRKKGYMTWVTGYLSCTLMHHGDWTENEKVHICGFYITSHRLFTANQNDLQTTSEISWWSWWQGCPSLIFGAMKWFIQFFPINQKLKIVFVKTKHFL